MKKVILAVALVMAMASVAAADTYVQGRTNPYTGQKGTQPHEFSTGQNLTNDFYKGYGM